MATANKNEIPVSNVSDVAPKVVTDDTPFIMKMLRAEALKLAKVKDKTVTSLEDAEAKGLVTTIRHIDGEHIVEVHELVDRKVFKAKDTQEIELI